MTSIDRSSLNKAAIQPPVDDPRGPKKKPAFDPLKAAQKQQVESPGPDPFAEAIREASDGDSDEGVLRSTLGMADDDQKSKSASDDKSKKRPEVSGAQALDAVGGEKDQASSTDAALRARQQAILGDTTASESVKEVTAVEVSTDAVSERHQELMLLSGSMERAQTATHIAQEAADGVTRIQQTPMWQKDETQIDHLVASQMTAIR